LNARGTATACRVFSFTSGICAFVAKPLRNRHIAPRKYLFHAMLLARLHGIETELTNFGAKNAPPLTLDDADAYQSGVGHRQGREAR